MKVFMIRILGYVQCSDVQIRVMLEKVLQYELMGIC